MRVERMMSQARTDLLMSQPFFASLSLRLQLRPDPTCETAWTDGASLGYNPEWIANMRPAQRVGLIAHEVLHCANGHAWRRDGREPRKWNAACDHPVNLILTESGLELPDGGLCDPQFRGQSAEAVFGSMPDPPPGDGGGNDPGGCGEVRDQEGPPEPGASEQDWKIATLQAIQEAKRAGSLPAGLDRLVNRIKQPACQSLVAALLEFAARSARDDYSWSRPNRRYIPYGLYLPCLHSVTIPPIAVGVDTSGSVSPEVLSTYVEALSVVLDEVRPEALVAYAADAAVHARREYLPGDAIDPAGFPGGGGTDFRPVFAAIEEEALEPCACVYLTDLQGRFPDAPPDYPTLWVVVDPQGYRKTAPFGATIWLDG